MKCPACKKKVVFGSIRGETWAKVSRGDWLLGGAPPVTGILGDCPSCGTRLEWEPGEEPTGPVRTLPLRVHLSALRESSTKFDGRTVALRAILIEADGGFFLSDSWKTRRKDGTEESDAEAVARLAKEQTPRIDVEMIDADAEARFRETALVLTGTEGRVAWVETVGAFRANRVHVTEITSVWRPKV